MAKKTITVCDRCGEDARDNLLSIKSTGSHGFELSADLCCECALDIAHKVGDWFRKEENVHRPSVRAADTVPIIYSGNFCSAHTTQRTVRRA